MSPGPLVRPTFATFQHGAPGTLQGGEKLLRVTDVLRNDGDLVKLSNQSCENAHDQCCNDRHGRLRA